MSSWQISNPPTEADHFKACGLFDADLGRAMAALGALEAHGIDRLDARRVLGATACSDILTGAAAISLRGQGFDLDKALGRLPKYAGVDVWEQIPKGRVPFVDVLEAIEGTT